MSPLCWSKDAGWEDYIFAQKDFQEITTYQEWVQHGLQIWRTCFTENHFSIVDSLVPRSGNSNFFKKDFISKSTSIYRFPDVGHECIPSKWNNIFHNAMTETEIHIYSYHPIMEKIVLFTRNAFVTDIRKSIDQAALQTEIFKKMFEFSWGDYGGVVN